MAEQVNVPGPTGGVLAELSRPTTTPAPAVLVLATEEGHIRAQICDRLAAAGFFAAAPDVAPRSPDGRAGNGTHRTVDIAAAAVGLLLGQPGMKGTSVGIVAFPDTATQALGLAGTLHGAVNSVVLYGGDPPEQPPAAPVLVLLDEQVGRREALRGGPQVNVRMLPGVPVGDARAVAAGGSQSLADVWEATVKFLRRAAES